MQPRANLFQVNGETRAESAFRVETYQLLIVSLAPLEEPVVCKEAFLHQRDPSCSIRLWRKHRLVRGIGLCQVLMKSLNWILLEVE